MATIETNGEHASFGGRTGFYSHRSEVCGGEMRFAVYTPPQAADGPVPVLYYLAGLTCTEETFMIKGGAQRLAAEHGLLLVSPDTSPRDADVPGEAEDWDFGTGAGCHGDATAEPWPRPSGRARGGRGLGLRPRRGLLRGRHRGARVPPLQDVRLRNTGDAFRRRG